MEHGEEVRIRICLSEFACRLQGYAESHRMRP
jgi:hypothetical protein